MSRLRHISIRYKQMLIIMLTSTVALVLACLTFVTYEAFNFRADLVEEMSGMARIAGNNCIAALDFNDALAAEDTLGALRSVPPISYACIYDPRGNAFAIYRRDGTNLNERAPSVESDGHSFRGDDLHLFLPIESRGEEAGTIYLKCDLDQLRGRVQRYAIIASVVLVVTLLTALTLSAWLHRYISNPIQHLADITRVVALKKNYSVRAVKQGDDELGQLMDGFNEMLTQIQERDAALESARNTLEQRVEERTRELANSLSLLNATLESTTDGILALDLSGNVMSYNTKFTDIWQFPPEMLQQPRFEELVAHAAQRTRDPEQFLELTGAAMSAPGTSTFDLIELKDGRIFERNALPQWIEGACVGVVINLRDITERKNAEEELQVSRALYHSLVEQLPAGIFRKDGEGRYVFVNSWFCRLKNVKAESFVGRTPGEVSAEELQQPRVNPWEVKQLASQGTNHHQMIMESGRSIEVEEHYSREDGSSRCFHVVKSPVFGSDGKIVGSQGIIFDITRHKQVEEALQNSQALYLSLVEQLPAGIFRKDKEGRYVLVNSWLCRLKQMQPDEILGRTPAELAHYETEHQRNRHPRATELFAAGADHHERILRTGEQIEVEEEWPDTEGRTRHFHVIKSPVTNPDGAIIGSQGIMLDITERKRAEAEVETIHRQLLDASRQAGMAEVATSVLHNVGNVLNSVNVSATLVADGLRKSKAGSLGRVVSLLDEHSADLGEFVTNDPKGKQLTAFLRQLSEHLTREQREAATELESLRKNIEHIKDIVAMQQSYANVSGQKEFLNVTDLVEDSLRMNAGALMRHDVKLIREYQEVPSINVEKHKVLQILVNLIRNAKYACDDGGGNDKQLTMRLDHDTDWIKISVVDNGVGIEPENLTRIFSHGFTTRSDGHGFGLHSGALAAREMGGTLRVHSDGPGLGATFTLELPITNGKTPRPEMNLA